MELFYNDMNKKRDGNMRLQTFEINIWTWKTKNAAEQKIWQLKNKLY